MPISAVTAGLITSGASAGSGLISGALNRRAQRKQNEKDRAFTEHMYERQRIDALADWNRENEYNHPLQQMNRLRQAGLNPHLVYGTGANTTADAVRSASVSQSSQPAPQYDPHVIPSAIAQFYQTRQQNAMTGQIQAQTDNLLAQRDLMAKEGLLKDATTAKTLQDVARSKYDLEMAQELKDMVVYKAKLENIKTATDIDLSLERNERERLASTYNLAKTLEDILTARLGRAKTRTEIDQLKIMIENAKKEGEIKDIEIRLRKMGINPNSPLWEKIIGQFLLKGGHAFGGVSDPNGPLPSHNLWNQLFGY